MPNGPDRIMKSWVPCVLVLTLTSCVSHHARIAIPDIPSTALNKAVFQDGAPITSNHDSAQGPLPIEMYVDAWYRDEDGKLFRAQSHVATARPWWQRFPADFFTDGLWPQDLKISVDGRLLFRPCESLTTDYLDQLSAAHGF